MKKMILVLTLLASSYSQAAQECAAYYAAGIGHVFNGEAVQLGQLERIKEGQSSSDELYTVSVNKGQPDLRMTKSGEQVELASGNQGLAVFSSRSLSVYPKGIPGAQTGNKFIIILCAPEGSF